MGEVVSIRRTTDDDLFDFFNASCPKVPVELDEKVKRSAGRAVQGQEIVNVGRPSFRTACLLVASVSLIGLMLVRGVSVRWNDAVESAASYANSTSSTANQPQLAAAQPVSSTVDSWRRNKSAWAAYIETLESDPFYQHVLSERRKFKERYPE